MSKIFEALQRAQQQFSGQTPAAPPPAAAVPDAVAPPPAPEAAAVPETVSVAPAAPPAPLAPAVAATVSPVLYDTPALTLPAMPAAVVESSGEPGTLAAQGSSVVQFSPRSKVVVMQNPTSLAAEQYRVLRTNIVKLGQTQPLKVILVTSPGPGDGKSLTSMNMALSFCQKPGTRVLLIEADLRKPSLAALVALDPGPGLADYLAGGYDLEQVVRPSSIPNFFLLESGTRPAAPADLLHSPRLDAMMEELRAQYDWIVLDGPPTNPVADYELLTPVSDGVVVVVRPYYTQRDLLSLTAEALRGRKVLGCVVNGSKHFERYGSAYGYGYGYGPDNASEPASQKKKLRRKKRITVVKEE